MADLRLPSRLAITALLILSATMVEGASDEARASDEEILRRQTQELLDAVAPGNVDVWDRYLHDELVHIDENGQKRTKAER